MSKEYLLVKENTITNGRYLTPGAIVWPGSPIAILNRQTWDPIGSLVSFRRENNLIYGTSENFNEDVVLAVYITNIKSEQKEEFLYITHGILRAAMIEDAL
jgi:hypothetical protein